MGLGESFKTFSGLGATQSALSGDGKGFLKRAVEPWNQTSQALGFTKDPKKEQERRDAEAEQNERNRLEGEATQGKAEARDTQFNKDERGRIDSYTAKRDGVYGELDLQSKTLEGQQAGLLREADAQSNDVSNVYSNLSQRMDKVVNESENEAKSAMTLGQYMDPANSAAFKNVNGLYQTQADNEGRSGMADFGVMSSLGAQSAGQGMAGMGPLTAGQQMGMLANSQRQAGEAYSNTQRRMQNLRDQGLQTGLNFHGQAYQAGRDAKDRYGNAMKDQEGVAARGIQNMGALRGERGGFQAAMNQQQGARSGRKLGQAQENYGMESGFSRDIMGRANALGASRLGLADKDYGKNMGAILRQDQAAESAAATNRQMAGTAVAVGGAAFTGGASLAAAGAMGGGGGGTAIAPANFAPMNSVQPGVGAQPLAPSPQFNMQPQQQPMQQDPRQTSRYTLQNRMAG